MSKIDQDLAAALKQAKTKSMYFALVMKSPGEGTLIVSKNKVLPKAIDEAKRDLGGGQIVQGRVSGDATGSMIFKTAKAPAPTLTKTLKAVITRDAGLTLKVDVQQAADVGEDDETGTTDSSTITPSTSKNAAAAGPDQAGITKRLGVVVADYTKLQSSPVAKGPDAKSLRSQFDTVKAAIAKQDWQGAAKILDEVERLLARAKAGALLYQLGYENGNATMLGQQTDKMRDTLQKQPDFAELIHYYDEGFQAGQAAPPKVRDFTPNTGPTMSQGHKLTDEEKERDREIDESRRELRRILSGQDDENPHVDPEPPKLPEPPVGD